MSKRGPLGGTRYEISRREFVIGTTASSVAVGLKAMIPAPAPNAGRLEAQIDCHVLVCGATPSGIAAAVTAARMGRHVILAEYEDHIGGILVNGLTNTDLSNKHRAAVGGFFNQFTNRVLEHYHRVDADTPDMPNVRVCREGFAYEPQVAEAVFNQFVAEQAPRLRVLLRHELKQAVMDRNRLTGAIFGQRDSSRYHRQINAEVLIDATYEGDLAAMANAEFRLGREGKDDFGEPHAGRIYMKFGLTELLPGSTGEADKAIQSFCFRFTATSEPLNRVPVEKPAEYDRSAYHYLLEDIRAGKVRSLDQVFGVWPMPRGKVEFNSHEVSPTTSVPSESLDLAEECWPWPEATWTERRRIYERYLTHNVGMLWMLQNDPGIPAVLRQDAQQYGWCKDEFVNNNHLPRQVYVREGRRIEGEYLLTEHDGDFAEGWKRTRIQPTSIGLVEWPFDSHACHRYDPDHPGTREGYTFVEHPIFQIPYGVVVPKTVDGLLVPVACSATHLAYNGLRMEPVFMILGEACGQAAHLAINNKVPIRAVPVGRLQKHLLENGGAITYFDDMPWRDDAFVACQWLGARGLNDGYQAETMKTLTRAQGAERLRRVLESMKHRWDGPGEADLAGPLKVADVISWLGSAGFNSHEANQPEELLQDPIGGISVGQFAQLLYRAIEPIS